MIGLLAFVGVTLTVCRASNMPSEPRYPKEYSEYKWNDPEHNRIRKKKMLEWGEQLFAQDKDDSFLQMQNEIKASLPKVRFVSPHTHSTTYTPQDNSTHNNTETSRKLEKSSPRKSQRTG